jgi:NAD(P) transhydrogenase subunit alpha
MPEALLNNLYILVLAMFTGFEVITKVPPLLHTPLMSGSNAISGISVVGALIITAEAAGDNMILALGVIAVAMGMINVAGGFLVTDRMLEMFKKKPADGGGEE